MSLIVVPNVSEGRRREVVDELAVAVECGGGRVLDVHADLAHNRSVFTVTGNPSALVEGSVRLAEACRALIDLRSHSGVHPRVGALDVCPFVPLAGSIDDAVEAARRTAVAIGDVGIPVYLYGAAALRHETRELRDLRRGGLDALRLRALHELSPDHGPRAISAETGVVCVGARGPLIAFNVWLRCSVAAARSIAREVRDAHLRALGLEIDAARSQVSMNLVQPDIVGIDEAFERVRVRADRRGLPVIATEIVGLPEERFLPDPGKQAARLLIEPGRSLERALSS